MLTPAAKRRRAEAASATLSRPFRSPAVRGKPGDTGATPTTPQLSGLATELAAGLSAEETRTGSPGQSNKRPRQLSVSGVSLPTSRNKRLLKRTSIPPAPVLLDNLIDQFTLELDAGDRLIKETQPRRLGDQRDEKEKRKPDIYDELPGLIIKWREAGRLAAEEVYEFVSKRIAAAGGIKAWRAMAAAPLQEEDDRECSQRPCRGDDDDGEDEEECEDDEGEQARRERERAEEEAKEEQERAEAETSQNFTMAMMLAHLNVEPDLLGYDEAEEQWRD